MFHVAAGHLWLCFSKCGLEGWDKGNAQQLGATANLLLCPAEQYGPLAGDPNQAELPIELLSTSLAL